MGMQGWSAGLVLPFVFSDSNHEIDPEAPRMDEEVKSSFVRAPGAE